MLSGKSGFMDKRELESYCGDLAQVFGIEECVLEDGKARGTRGYLLDNGCGLEMIVLRDKCFTIPKLKFKGVNIGLITKAGICGPWFYQEDGTRGFLRNFEGGFLTTCGLTYMGTPGEENGNKNGLHGVISNTPMEHAKPPLLHFFEVKLSVAQIENGEWRMENVGANPADLFD